MTLQYIGANLYLNTAYWHFVKWILKHMPWIRQIRHFILKKEENRHSWLSTKYNIQRSCVWQNSTDYFHLNVSHSNLCTFKWTALVYTRYPNPYRCPYLLVLLGQNGIPRYKAKNFAKKIALKSNFFPHPVGGGLFCQVTTNVRFNDAWNISAWSYVMCHDTSRVSHQKAEIGGGGFSADLLALSFCQLNTVVFRFNTKD